MSDAFGRMVEDYYRGELQAQPVYRRSDGETTPAHCAWYFTGPEEWGEFDREGIGFARGAVLDIGSGVGRAVLWLRDRGQFAIGVDASPRAVAVSRERGAPAVVGEMTVLPVAEDTVDTALFVGTHVGAVGTIDGLRSLLDHLDRILCPGGRIIADIYDPTLIEQADLQSYLDGRFLAEGIATRQFRLEYNGDTGDWMTLLLCSPAGLDRIVEPTAWAVEQIHRSEGTRYYFVLERNSAENQ